MRLLAAAVAALLCAAPLSAEHHEDDPEGKDGQKMEQMTPAQQADKMLSHMEKELKLTADQKSKLKPLIEKGAADRKEMHEKFQKAEREHSEQVRALLTDEQKEKYDMMRARRKMMGRGMGKRMKERMERRRGRKGPGGAEAGPGGEPEDHDGPPERE